MNLPSTILMPSFQLDIFHYFPLHLIKKGKKINFIKMDCFYNSEKWIGIRGNEKSLTEIKYEGRNKINEIMIMITVCNASIIRKIFKVGFLLGGLLTPRLIPGSCLYFYSTWLVSTTFYQLRIGVRLKGSNSAVNGYRSSITKFKKATAISPPAERKYPYHELSLDREIWCNF